MTKRYGIYGPNTRDFLTYGGRILVHSNRAELEWLLPRAIIRELPGDIPTGQTLPIEHHPSMCNVRFPLRKVDFR